MTLGFGIKIILEVLVIMLIAYGIMNEEKLIAFEDELYPVLKFCFHKYILRDTKKNVRHRPVIRVINGKKQTSSTENKGVA